MKRMTPRQSSLVLISMASASVSALSRRAGLLDSAGPVSRRTLMRLSGLGLASLGSVVWSGRAAATWLGQAPLKRATNEAFTNATICVLSPEETEGPYYIANEKVHKNIVEQKHGTPLALRLAVVDAATCMPIKDAVVDVWHCDAAGVYAGFGSASTAGNGGGNGGPPPGGTPGGGNGGPGGGSGPTDKRTFLRGIQRTDAQGLCGFDTIYPGWYTGRTVHIHVKVHVGGKVVHTGQLFFADNLTDKVFQTGVYKGRPARDTRNAADGIYAGGGLQSTLAMRHTAAGGYVGTITLGVKRA